MNDTPEASPPLRLHAAADPDRSPAAAPRHLPLLLLLFFDSGCAALIYEIVWFQMLQLVIGSTAISLAVLLGTFMGGMCAGSLLLPRVVPATRHPLRVYATLEAGIAVCGVFVLFTMPLVNHLYVALAGHGLPDVFLRAAVCVLCLLPPTILMGATLPAVARWIETTPRGIAWLGFFYGGNTLGAVAGCVAAGFYLLRLYDVGIATYAAVTLNLLVAAVAVSLAKAERLTPDPQAVAAGQPRASGFGSDSADSETTGRSSASPLLLLAIALSGFCALAAEVVWTRILSLLLGATVYTFSIILAVFLVGLGVGSSIGAALARDFARPRLALGLCQLLQLGGIAWAAHTLAVTLPHWPIDNALATTPWEHFQLDVARCAWAILPAAILWGASFPLALAGLATRGADAARVVARAYAANTLGAIAGAVLASLVLVPRFGTQSTQGVLIGIAVAAALCALPPRNLYGALTGLAAVVVVWLTATRVPKTPWQLVAYGRQVASSDYGAHALLFAEGMNSSVAVSQTPDGARFFHVSGKTEASSLPKDMRLQRMLGHLPALLHREPHSVLIVGCGAGVTAGSFVLHPSIRRIVICDIEPLIPQRVAPFFRQENYDVVHDPRVQVVHDDARHFVATTHETFDIITSDPIHPWVKGSAVLYSLEYFELCRARLNPGGLVTQWIPLYESDRDVVRSEIATFSAAFPGATIWANDDEGYGYDTVILGQAGALRIDLDAVQARLDRPDHARVRASLAEVGFGSAVALLSTFASRDSDLKTWLRGAEINRDRNLRLQYLAGLQLDATSGADTYYDLLYARRFPEDLFAASGPQLAALQAALAKAPASP